MKAENPNRMVSFFNKLGPGLLLAATSIGASHLVMSPKAGSMFGYQLLWLVLLTHLFKYHAFEFGPRYAAATGESLIAGYMRVPGPRGWALWVFLLGTVAQGIGVLAGVVGIAASVLDTFIGHLSYPIYTALVIISILLFLLFGKYGWLDLLNKIMMFVLFAATIAVFVPVFPRPQVFVNFVVPSIPAGSIALIAAIVGFMPTGIDVSIWHSMWTLEKHSELISRGATSAKPPGRRMEILKISLADMRIGYVLSFVVASVFLVLGALFLQGAAKGVAGVGFAQSLADIYIQRVGPWMYFVFMLAAFTAMYSTSYTVMDGFSRSFAESLSQIFPNIRSRWWGRSYWAFVLATSAFAFLIVVTVREPVRLVMLVALLSFCVAPLYYWLNYYCVTRFVTEPGFRLRMFARIIAPIGIVLMLSATLMYILFKLGVLDNLINAPVTQG